MEPWYTGLMTIAAVTAAFNLTFAIIGWRRSMRLHMANKLLLELCLRTYEMQQAPQMAAALAQLHANTVGRWWLERGLRK